MKNIKKFFSERLPENISKYYQMQKARPFWLSAGIIFIHIPKNAGVSISQATYGSAMGHWTLRDIKRQHCDLYDQLPIFATVRNPFDRLQSAYRFARQGKGLGIEKGPEMKNKALYQGKNFENFESFVCDWLPSADISKADYIFRPQKSFLEDDFDQIAKHQIFRVENIQEVDLYLSEHFKKNIKLKCVNYTIPDPKTRINSEMEKIIRQVYSSDFKQFYPDF